MANGLDLDAIEARAIAAGGHEAAWRFNAYSVDSDEDYIYIISVTAAADEPILSEDTPDDEKAVEDRYRHIAGMDPATTLRLVAEIRRLRETLEDIRSAATPSLGASPT